MANSELVAASELTVKLLPVAVSFPVLLSFDPTVTVPKLRLEGETPSLPAALPVPTSTIPSRPCPLEFLAPNSPQTVPLEVGEKAILKVKLCPGIRVTGTDKPRTENPEPVVTAFAIVTGLFLPFLMTTAELTALPADTLPKTMLSGVAYSDFLDCPIPMIFRDAPLIAISPDVHPVTAGLKATVMAMLSPGKSFTGKVGC